MWVGALAECCSVEVRLSSFGSLDLVSFYSLCLFLRLSLFSSDRCWRFLLLLAWMMLCIRVEALRKPQGTEGRAEQTPPRKESLPGVDCSDKLLTGGRALVLSWFFFFFACICFLCSLPYPHFLFLKHLSQSLHLLLFILPQPFHLYYRSVSLCWRIDQGGADVPAFHHSALTEYKFHTLSI